MFANLTSTSSGLVTFRNDRSITTHQPAARARAKAGLAGSLARLAVLLLVLGMLAALAVLALLPVVLLGLMLLLPALLPLLVVLGGVIATDSALAVPPAK